MCPILNRHADLLAVADTEVVQQKVHLILRVDFSVLEPLMSSLCPAGTSALLFLPSASSPRPSVLAPLLNTAEPSY